MANKTDLMNLAKEMQNLSETDKEYTSDKEYFLHQLVNCQNLRAIHLEYSGYEYLRFRKILVSVLTKKLSEKSAACDDLCAKKRLVLRGVHAYMEASEKECDKFHKIVYQKPTVAVKALSGVLCGRKNSNRVHE